MELAQVIINLLGAFTLSFGTSVIGKSSKSKNNFIKYSVIALIFFVITTFVGILIPSYVGSKIEPYISIVIIILSYMVIFKEQIFKSTFYFFFGFLVIAIYEIITLVVLNLMGITLEDVLNNNRLVAVMEMFKLMYTLLMARTNVFRKFTKKIESVMQYIVAFIVNLFIFIQMMRIMTDAIVNGKDFNYLYIYILFFILLTVNALLIRYALKSQKEVEQLKSYKEYEKLIIPLIEQSRSIEHDFKNHLLTLKGLANSDKHDEFEEYLKLINSDVDKNSVYKICNNPVMGALLHEKSRYAYLNDIDFDINVYEGDNLSADIKPHHLIAVISNLIDNAFEEVETISGKEKKVFVEYINNGNIEINVKNTLGDALDVDLSSSIDHRVSSKGKSRGYGLMNIKKIAKHYNGDFQVYHYDDSINIKVVLNS